jgi:pyridoxamine 5'-phosphate oxidase
MNAPVFSLMHEGKGPFTLSQDFSTDDRKRPTSRGMTPVETSMSPNDALIERDPLEIFREWYAEAERAKAPFVDAFALATVDAEGRPSVRYVLFKGIAEGTLRFVTNFESKKARDLEGNPNAAIAFFWPATGRQVRMEGTVVRAPDADSDRYFEGRDRTTQLGAWASAQSRPLASRDELEREVARYTERFAGGAVPRPPHWGMLAFTPRAVELWVSGQNRLHDRFRYERDGDAWKVERLAP